MGNWTGGIELPPQNERHANAAFNPKHINRGRLFYIAAIPQTNPIPWRIQQGQAAYFNIFIPPGIVQLSMGINAVALAASQSVMFHDYGERACNAPLPNAPQSLADWQVMTGASNYTHERDIHSEFFRTGSCVFFGFFNRDNRYGAGIQLDEVAFTYMLGADESVFLNWANGGRITRNNPCNGKAFCQQGDLLILPKMDLNGALYSVVLKIKTEGNGQEYLSLQELKQL
jgi:hypothetical protein